jgi:hypothetical protein
MGRKQRTLVTRNLQSPTLALPSQMDTKGNLGRILTAFI